MNELLLRRKAKIYVCDDKISYDNQQLAAMLNKNIENLGYVLSKELFDRLSQSSVDYITVFYNQLIKYLKSYVGANVVYSPFYVNFPSEVECTTEVNLYINALVHYYSGGVLYPNTEENIRPELEQFVKLKVLSRANDEELELKEIFVNLLNSKTSLSEQDKDDIKWFFINRDISDMLPKAIPLKENCALVGALYIVYFPNCSYHDLLPYFKTATDVLRLAVALSEGDISLSVNTKFISFKTKHRKILLELLEHCNNIQEDMKRYKGMWLRLGERLHPCKYKRFVKVNDAFDKLRNGKISTWKGEVDIAFKNQDFAKATQLLSQRGGEFARTLDNLLRKTDDKTLVIDSFEKVVESISTPVLLQVKNHFQNRDRQRFIIKKGSTTILYKIDSAACTIAEDYCNLVVNICDNALINNYKKLNPLGKVYLSEEFKDYIVPFNQRAASKAMKTITMGSKVKIEDNANIVRLFIWWTNTKSRERVDVDLSALILDENFNFHSQVSYTNLTSLNMYHSGDIINGGDCDGEGVAEFIDVDINSMLENNGRYLVCSIFNYSNIKYSEMENIKFGWQYREKPNSGEIFEPKTVEQRIDLCCDSTKSVPVVFDCKERKFIWLDLSLSVSNVNYGEPNNIENNVKNIDDIIRLLLSLKKANLYDLINLHIQARGELTLKKSDADIIFDVNEGVTPFDIDEIVGKYL